MESLSYSMNVKGQRNVVSAIYKRELAFKIPDGIDLEDTNMVQRYFVRGETLHIVYANKDKEPEELSCDWSNDIEFNDAPDTLRIEPADSYGIEYSEDEEDERQATANQCEKCFDMLEEWENEICNTCNNILEPNCKCNTKCDICNNYLNCECPK
jgi:hypothetical protein